MSRNQLVSVYITTCNRLEKLKKALASVQNQTYTNIEIIVADDSSSDGTEAYMCRYIKEFDNVKYIRNNERKGACINRNNAISLAQGYFITGLDDDDEFTNNRVELFIENWDDKYSFLCANYYNVYDEEKFLAFSKKQKNREYNYKNLLFHNVATNQVFTKTDYLKSINGFSPEMRRLQDWDTWLRLAYLQGQFLFLKECTYYMHHQTKAEVERVSNSYSIDKALEDFLKKNKKIFGWRFHQRMCYVNYLQKKLTLVGAIYWSMVEFNPLNFIRYFTQK